MYKNYIIAFCIAITLLAACSKENGPAPLTDGSISFEQPTDVDTLQMPVSILKDSAIVIGLRAALSGNTSSSDHWVSFAVDTTKITAYRNQYGEAMLLPTTSYLFFKPTARMAAGTILSDSVQLNIGKQTKLTEYSTYVLPVVIQSVDGQVDGAASSRVLYLVFKTGKPLFVNKTGWTIAGYSSQYSTSLATKLLDNNTTTTYWTSDILQQMPQWVSINFNKEVTFTAVNYYIPSALRYPTYGGYPTSIQLETSMDGQNWQSLGIFKGNIVDNMQTLNTGEVTARYLRFTVLAAVKYGSLYDCVFISDISLIP